MMPQSGRNSWRDCVHGVYGPGDPTEGPSTNNGALGDHNDTFAPQFTFTVADAIHAADPDLGYADGTFIAGKWHLGDFFKGRGAHATPLMHGFDHMFMTQEVAPTSTTNCACDPAWESQCRFGHNKGWGCTNYWTEDPTAPEGIVNMSTPVGANDAALIVDKFEAFVESRHGRPFLSLLLFHNNHIPFVATAQGAEACASGAQCPAGRGYDVNQPNAQLDYFGALIDIDVQIGRVREILKQKGYAESTLVWLASDNGPEVNAPNGFIDAEVGGGLFKGPGEARPLRGRKRDFWEGGHRVPGILEFPPLIHKNIVSHHTMVTTDLLPTIMDLLNVTRPPAQAAWGLDGQSVVPAMRGEPSDSFNQFGRGWLFWRQPSALGGAFRYGDWKFVNQSHSCGNTSCNAALYNLKDDLGETTDLSKTHPEIFEAMALNLSVWKWHVINSSLEESFCTTPYPPGPPPRHPAKPPLPSQ